FAGNGDLLQQVLGIGNVSKIKGLDIDRTLPWEYNDSLINIPPVADAIIVTNPPYLTNYSAKRMNLQQTVKQYFKNSKYDDVYQIALNNCLNTCGYVVALIPETFINSSFQKNRVHNITVLEDNPFFDTENPICVVCFDDVKKEQDKILVYKNGSFISRLSDLERQRLEPNNSVKLRFNDLSGRIAIRAVDTTDPQKPIEFMLDNELDYDRRGIKESSRLITLVSIKHYNDRKLRDIVEQSNAILKLYRENTADILLSPFKGKTKSGIRRRRLDYKTARAILEKAINAVDGHIENEQTELDVKIFTESAILRTAFTS
ncbi:MAG: hypothetical protein Q8J62_07135, partial [Candidatus Cloacimonadaceae bacterium]|nr:hypothetical protein [Candidatus Cloacimonadaceae bacterium]